MGNIKNPVRGICPECKSFSLDLEAHRRFHRIREEANKRDFQPGNKVKDDCNEPS